LELQIGESRTGDDQEILARLISWFGGFRSCIIAYSSGVDSSLLAYCAKKAIGENAHAVTSLSTSFSEAEEQAAIEIAREIGIDLIVVEQDDLDTVDYVKNGVTRCYFCRQNLAQAIAPIRQKLSAEVCVDGTHVDDMKTPRPGIKALREAGYRAPYVELGLGKDAIRSASRYAGLSNWNRPSEACLSSRIAFGQRIDLATLRRIELAENAVRRIVSANIVRVRTIGMNASVEVDKSSVAEAIERGAEISQVLQKLGYDVVEVDPEGYKSGKMLDLFVKEGA
jgi:pyridinium-3,5-biscarboxylic acid mononucleotide sulfurtransferase